ncbi:metallo-beta-lactamase superfamily protein [Echria macrotheca]|uniref:Metallo-beta-lactamase superfamily protein n=1 Tax=Echria macrotheca TaxID=438768 RepID=A0AAJ0BCV6_9PEZI|nr:metallo-beta-lactamase superfamily protein [Echria macrotheca]
MATPKIDIPASPNTVKVSIIDTTTRMSSIGAGPFFTPPIKGYEKMSNSPSYSFLIQHTASGTTRSLLFDLGLRKDWRNLPPVLVGAIDAMGWEMEIEKDVSDILTQGGVDPNTIEAIIWSHYHMDHIGDSSRFGPSTAVMFGPGVKESLLPGYPANPGAFLLESDYAGREAVELDFSSDSTGPKKWRTLQIGGFRAIDVFEDGSFYLLDSPGHAIGHICGLARISSGSGGGGEANKDVFLLMAGDSFHHGGVIRPSLYLPIPDDKTVDYKGVSCPCTLFKSVLPHGDETRPFFEPTITGTEAHSFHHDSKEALRTIEKLQKFDAQDNVFVVAAHDGTILDTVDLFPAQVNAALIRAWDEKVRWRFLADFAEAAGQPASR